jgi:type II secretory pathway component PulC
VKKEHIQLAVIGIGVLVLAFFLSTNLKPAAKRQAASGAPDATPSEAVIPAVPVHARARDKTTALQLKRWEAAWGRDPFWSVSDSSGKLNELELKGISFSHDKKGYAFINDQIVSSGDTLGGYEISRIEKDRVMLTRGSQTFFLTFSEDK